MIVTKTTGINGIIASVIGIARNSGEDLFNSKGELIGIVKAEAHGGSKCFFEKINDMRKALAN